MRQHNKCARDSAMSAQVGPVFARCCRKATHAAPRRGSAFPLFLLAGFLSALAPLRHLANLAGPAGSPFLLDAGIARALLDSATVSCPDSAVKPRSACRRGMNFCYYLFKSVNAKAMNEFVYVYCRRRMQYEWVRSLSGECAY